MPFYDSLAKINSNRRARPILVITYTSIFSKNFCGFLPDTNVYETKNQDLTSELETGIVAKTKYRDEELLCSLDWLCENKFRGKKYHDLRIEDRYYAAKELHRRYGCSVKQISRVTGLPADILKAMF